MCLDNQCGIKEPFHTGYTSVNSVMTSITEDCEGYKGTMALASRTPMNKLLACLPVLS